MPLHHYVCDDCHYRTEEYRSVQEGGSARPPACALCARGHDYGDPPVWMRRVIAPCAVDAKAPFQVFDVERLQPVRDQDTGQWTQGQVRETIDSASTARRIEADSERRYANGEGEPLRFRVYNQDASNMDVNSFGASGSIGGRAYDSGATPQKKPNIATTRHGSRKPRTPLARGGGVTALRDR